MSGYDPDAPHDSYGKASVAYDHLKTSAIHGRLRLGRRLAPHDLAEYYRISATPIRDAMFQLAIEGFIDRDPGRGFSVKPFSVEDQCDRHEMCFFYLSASLESLQRPPPTLLAELAALDPQVIAGSDNAPDVIVRHVEQVFECMASASHNAVLTTQARLVVDQTHLVRRLDLNETDALYRTIDRLRVFANAMLTDDREAARRVFRDKLKDRLARMPNLVRQANALAANARFP